MMCKPEVFGLWVDSSLAKLPSDRRVGGPRLGHDTSLVISTVLFVAIFCFKFHASLNNKNATWLYTYMSKGLQRGDHLHLSSRCPSPYPSWENF